MREKEIEAALVKTVKKIGGFSLKQTGMAGIPDRLILLPDGKCAFVELKAPGEKPRKLQEIRMKQLRKLGFKCYVIDGVEQIKKAIYDMGGDA